MQFYYSSGVSLDAIYFNTLPRFFPFAIGALAATVWGVSDKQDIEIRRKYLLNSPRWVTAGFVAMALGAAGVILFFLSQFRFTSEFVFRYGFLATSLLTVVMIYCAHALHLVTPRRVEEPAPLKAVSALSYDLYLFHWPLYVVFSALIMDNMTASLVTLVVSLVMSALMVYVAEPILLPQRGAAPRIDRQAASVILFAAAVFASVGAGMVIARAPLITSIESDFAAEYTLRDVSNIIALENRLLATDGLPTTIETPTVAAPPPSAETPVSEASPPDNAWAEMGDPPAAGVSENALLPPDETGLAQKSATAGLGFIGGVTIIGDSVSLGAQSSLTEAIPSLYMDASVSRPVSDGVEILTGLQEAYALREYVVIALGTNETANYKKLFTEMIDLLNPGHRLVLVTPYDGRANEYSQRVAEIASWIRELPDQYDFITVADWAAQIAPHSDWLASDKSHMGGAKSRGLYTDCIVSALDAAGQKSVK
jgi:hypothetical protein